MKNVAHFVLFSSRANKIQTEIMLLPKKKPSAFVEYKISKNNANVLLHTIVIVGNNI